MTALPAASDFTGAAVTEGQFKSAMTDLRGFLSGLLGTSGDTDDARAALQVLMGGSASKSTTYTALTSDNGKVLDCSGTFTVTLPAAASAGAGFTLGVYNSGAGTITVDGNLSETVDDATSVTVEAGKLKVFWCNGSEWASVGGGVGAPTLTTFTSTGTWTKKAASTIVISLLIGGGGGGGSGDFASLAGYVGQPGHAVVAVTLASSFGSSETVTIGSGGAGGTSGFPGNPGGQTSIGSIVKAKGGGGGAGPGGASWGAGTGTNTGAALIMTGPWAASAAAGAANTGQGGGINASYGSGFAGGSGKCTILEI